MDVYLLNVLFLFYHLFGILAIAIIFDPFDLNDLNECNGFRGLLILFLLAPVIGILVVITCFFAIRIKKPIAVIRNGVNEK